MVTQSICLMREIKNPNHHFIICYHLLKCHTAKWFSGIHINFEPLSKTTRCKGS